MGIVFTDRILDNVHGFIEFTDAEKLIINTLLFKRLQSIKQLSIANWIFPGSEHTRYIHSLGVMHIADKMAIQVGISEEDRKIIRMAGLLHDIGHYPLSHVCEMPYKKKLENYQDDTICQEVNRSIKQDIDNLSFSVAKEFMKSSKEGHHEAVGAEIIKRDPEIRKIVTDECGEKAIDIICDMITGNVKNEGTNPLWVQILHSEIDADGIDYMMRDATFAGTGFGSSEMHQLIRCLAKREYEGKEILCVEEKGVAAADQYLINKFFSYSQVVFNKHISNLEWMSQRVAKWMMENSGLFPRKEELLGNWLNAKWRFDSYLGFTDTFFWRALEDIKKEPNRYYAPEYIVELCKKLLNHEELKYVENSEIKIIGKDASDMQKKLQASLMYQEYSNSNKHIILCEKRPMTSHVPYDQFVEAIGQNIQEELDEEMEQFCKDRILLRYMEGICVCNDRDDSVHLLCDDDRSLMKQLYGTYLYVYRVFEFPVEDKEVLKQNIMTL